MPEQQQQAAPPPPPVTPPPRMHEPDPASQYSSYLLILPDDSDVVSLEPAQGGGQPQQQSVQAPPIPMPEPVPEPEPADPRAMVDGCYCPQPVNKHFNDPDVQYCRVCGLAMLQQTRQVVKGPRPPLGVLVLQDGSVCQLDTDYVLGREPTLDSSVADGSARPLRLGTASGLVSRIHARVELDGWQVFISDLNSANGTQILQPGGSSPETLQPGIRTPLAAGAQIRLGGDYGLRYDSHRHR
jgi:FHA domain